MKIAVLMNDNSYAGREYLRELTDQEMQVDAIVIGSYPSKCESEDERCGGLWNPPSLDHLQAKGVRLYRFSSLNDNELLRFLRNSEYDLGIQGGTGILRESVIGLFKYGILNFHPGDLPYYRGCSAPEWQLYEGKDVICTCHLIDEGIDTGKIYEKRMIFDKNTKNYHWMRAHIYPRISVFVADIIRNINADFIGGCVAQNEADAIYRKYIGEELLSELISRMNS